MKIKRFKAKRFGCLDGEYILNPNKVTLIVENNEEGKSTFVDGLLAGLYGFPSVKRSKDKITELDKFKPWNYDSYKIELEIELNGKDLLIKRDFDEGSTFVYDCFSGKDISENYYKGREGYPVGEFILQISRDVFSKTVLIHQYEIQNLKDLSSITKKIQSIVDTSSSDGTAIEAIDILNDALNKYSGYKLKGKGKVDSEIDRITKEIEEITVELENLDQKRQQKDGEMRNIEKLNEKEKKITLDMDVSDYLGKLAELKELKNKIGENDYNKEELEKYKKESESLKQLNNFPIDKSDVLLQMQGKLSTIESDIENEKVRKNGVEKEKEECEKELNLYKEFKDFSENEKREIDILFVRFKDILKKLKERKDEIEYEKEKIKEDGFKLEEYDGLKEIFDNVSDEDKDFIGDYNENYLKKNEEIRGIISEIGDFNNQVNEILDLRKKRRNKGIIISVLGLIVLLIISFFALGKFYFVSVFGIGLIFIIFGSILYLTASSLRSDEYVEFKNKVEQLNEKKDVFIFQKKEIEERIENLREKYNFKDFINLIERFKYYRRLDGRTDTLNSLKHNYEMTIKEVEEIKSEILRYVRKYDSNLVISDINVEFMEKFKRNIEKYFGLVNKKANLEKNVDDINNKIRILLKEKNSLEKEIYLIFEKAGINENININDGIEIYKNKVLQYNRYKKLKDELIPQYEKEILKNEDINIYFGKIRHFEKEIENIKKEYPDFLQYAPEKSSGDYYNEWKKLNVGLEEVRKEKSKLIDSARDVINEYRSRYPELQNELYTLKDILERTKKFKSSVNLAIENLENISSESYKNWAEILNKNVNDILSKINKNYEDLKFDSDLSFTIKPKDLDIICSQKEINYQLSSGARDQIYLSVRLALGKYFSKKGVKLPFIMDDPFVTSDDSRFIDGMKFITSELANEHQVILLTCHEKRHEYLKSIDSKWFDDNIEICFLKKIN